MSSRKGSAFEREFCKSISLWWSEGATDDLFWRSAGSGGRATTRAKKGQTTANAHGDIVVSNPAHDAALLLSLVTIELKRGYRDAHLGKALDRAGSTKESPLEQMLAQARRSAVYAATPHWLLVVKRDRCEALAYMPARLHKWLRCHNVVPLCYFKLRSCNETVCVMHLTDFTSIPPKHFKRK